MHGTSIKIKVSGQLQVPAALRPGKDARYQLK